MRNAVVASRLDICHQILDLYSQGKQQMPHHTPHQLQQPPSLQPTPQAPPVPPSQPPAGPEPPQPPQKDSQQPAQQPPPPPAQPPKKASPQPSPPRQAKRAVVSARAQHRAAGSPQQPHPRPRHTTLRVVPSLRGCLDCSFTACMSVGSWTAGVLGGEASGSHGSSVLQPLLLLCRGPRTCQGSFARPHTAGVGIFPVCQ